MNDQMLIVSLLRQNNELKKEIRQITQQYYNRGPRLQAQKDHYERENSKLKAQVKSLSKDNETLKGLVEELRQRLNVALDRIVQLERQINLDSSNSHKPPSSDGPKSSPVILSLRQVGQKPSGGQKGHAGTTLQMSEHVDQTVRLKATRCPRCQSSLKQQAVQRVIRRQVIGLEIKKVVTEYEAEVKVCTCGCVVKASFPTIAKARVQYDTAIKALVSYLQNQHFIPEDRVQQLCKDVFDLPMSTAFIGGCNERVCQHIQGWYEQLNKQLKGSAIKHMDETGFRVGGKLEWLHVMSDSQSTLYRTSVKRGEMPKDIKGIVIHDHFRPYYRLEEVKHGLCNAHHLRELKAAFELDKEPWAQKMQKLLQIANKLRAPPIQRIEQLYESIVHSGLRYHKAQELSNPVRGASNRKRRPGHNLVRRLKVHQEEVLLFLRNAEVPFTNNQAENDLRMMKVKQKISGGFRTQKAAQAFCIIRSLISTCRKRGLNILKTLQQAFEGKLTYSPCS